MTFPLDFDLLVIGVLSFKAKKKHKKKTKKKQKTKNKKQKTKKKEKKKKKKCEDMFVSHILLHRFFVVGFISGGLSEIL